MTANRRARRDLLRLVVVGVCGIVLLASVITISRTLLLAHRQDQCVYGATRPDDAAAAPESNVSSEKLWLPLGWRCGWAAPGGQVVYVNTYDRAASIQLYGSLLLAGASIVGAVVIVRARAEGTHSDDPVDT